VTRRWPPRPAATLAALVALCGTVCGADAPPPVAVVVSRAGDGDPVVAARTVPPDGVFALAYVHSVYRAPAVEIFQAAGPYAGGAAGAPPAFIMRAIASPDSAVIDYYALAGAQERLGRWWVLRPAQPATYRELPLITTAIGLRTLVVGRECLPLFPARGARHVRITIARHPPVGEAARCPVRWPQQVAGNARAGQGR
jgi:hypothetical protein